MKIIRLLQSKTREIKARPTTDLLPKRVIFEEGLKEGAESKFLRQGPPSR